MTEEVLPKCGWRLTRRKYSDLTGEGARRVGGRWNSPGRAAVYLCEEAALPVLEVLVHLDLPPDLVPSDYVLMRVELDALGAVPGRAMEQGPEGPLTLARSRRHGDAWLEEARTPLLRVPSAIVPESFNLVLNPAHPAAASLPPPASRPFGFDPRLL